MKGAMASMATKKVVVENIVLRRPAAENVFAEVFEIVFRMVCV